MKPLIFLLMLFGSLQAQVWSQLPDFPGSKRDDGVAVVVGNKAYFGTGLQEGWLATHNWYALDLNTHSWSKLPDMPSTTERQYACAFAGNNCFFVFGGDGVGGALNNLYKFDIAGNSWLQMSSKPGAGLSAASCMAFGDKVIIACGKLQTTGMMNREVWEYTISSNTWIQKNNIPFAGRWRAGATALHNFGYLLFGIDSAGFYRRELYRYDRHLDSWNKISDFPMAKGRAYSAVEGVADKLFVFGGCDSAKTYYNDVWHYNDILNTWSVANAMPSFGRRGGMSCVANANFYYACGIDKDDNRQNQAWMTDVPLALKNNFVSNSIAVYPIPVRDFLSVEVPANSEYRAQLVSPAGDLLLDVDLETNGVSKLDLTAVNAGVYLLKLYSGTNYMGSKKIIKAAE